jgi:hypothetical protein
MNEHAWVISANMGLGHQRATYPLAEIAWDGIYMFGEDTNESRRERLLWNIFRESYEIISRTRNLPVLGPRIFGVLERLSNISPYYPFRDLSKPSLQVKSLYALVERGMGEGLARKVAQKRLPLVTSFYASAVAAEELTDLPVYCIICDADINRVWVPDNPEKSRIIYFAPCGHAMRRLKQYGVPDERIYLTGFPLPKENIGGSEMDVLRKDLAERLIRLDPTKRFRTIHGQEARHYLEHDLSDDQEYPLTITYAVGGAGAQADIARDVLFSFTPRIKEGRVRLNLVAGVRPGVAKYFEELISKVGLSDNDNVRIIFQPRAHDYFIDFSRILHSTDILWSKPSELSFYCGLGIPLVMAPCIGPHEEYNRQWLREIGAGIPQHDPRYCGEWIFDLLLDGRLAQAAWDGFLYARKMGVYKIEEILATGTMQREISPIKR